MATTVVNVNSGTQFDIYIGRRNRAHSLPASIWANPFHIGVHGTREEVIEQYRLWLFEHPALLKRVGELRDRRLGCWCVPLPCHGDILAELADTEEE